MKIFIQAMATMLLVINFSALAHTDLTQSAPANGAVVQQPPQQLRLEFGDDVRLVEIMLHAEDGSMLPLDFEMSMQADKEFTVPVKNELEAGTYTVYWVAMGGDAHKISSEFSFELKL